MSQPIDTRRFFDGYMRIPTDSNAMQIKEIRHKGSGEIHMLFISERWISETHGWIVRTKGGALFRSIDGYYFA